MKNRIFTIIFSCIIGLLAGYYILYPLSKVVGLPVAIIILSIIGFIISMIIYTVRLMIRG
jgi:uncharacterized membrane protein YcaP (DUF421 family)